MNTKINISIYCGMGASHSWLWFVDLMERHGLYNVFFMDEMDVKKNMLKGIDVLIISGGDTFALAKALGKKGALEIEDFVKRGGLYMGSCAGAYLPMHSSKEFLKEFNFVKVKIANLSKVLPRAIRLKEKFFTCYGCRYVFHPIRGETKVKLGNGFELVAPVYGGPSMIPEKNCEVLGRYYDFTPKTIFLTDKKIAENTFIGKGAIIKSSFGKGTFYLFGPHMEHPKYSQANRYIIDILQGENSKKSQKPPLISYQANMNEIESFIKFIKREISNSRIVAYSMEHTPVRWKIEEKVYEPQKIILFLEYIWRRIIKLERDKKITSYKVPIELIKELKNVVTHITPLIRKLKISINQNINSTELAKGVISHLLMASKIFFTIYFSILKQKEKICITQ